MSAKKGDVPRAIGRTKGGINSKLHAVTDGQGRPVLLELTEGQASDYKGARALIDNLPRAEEILADRGYDADWFREALRDKDIEPCIPPKKNRKVQHEYDKDLYKKRHVIENSFAKLKDWRRVATRYDRRADIFKAAITIACIVIWWI